MGGVNNGGAVPPSPGSYAPQTKNKGTFLTVSLMAGLVYPDKRRREKWAYQFKCDQPVTLFSSIAGEGTPTKLAKQYRNPVVLAQGRQQLLVTGEIRSRAELSKRIGVSRARVTQMLRLLQLPADVLDSVATPGDLLPRPFLTERALRPLVGLPVDEQRQRIFDLGTQIMT
jgi:hypothetical protein